MSGAQQVSFGVIGGAEHKEHPPRCTSERESCVAAHGVSNQRCVGFRILAHKRQTSGIHSSGRLTRIPIERRRRKGALRAQARSDARLHAPRGLGQTSVYMTALHPDRGRSLKKDESFIRVVYRNAYKGDGGSTYTHTTQERRDTSPTQDTFLGQLRRGLRVCTDWYTPLRMTNVLELNLLQWLERQKPHRCETRLPFAAVLSSTAPRHCMPSAKSAKHCMRVLHESVAQEELEGGAAMEQRSCGQRWAVARSIPHGGP